MQSAANRLLSLFVLVALQSLPALHAQTITLVTTDPNASQPAINDSGVIIYGGGNHQIFAANGSVLISGAELSNIGISNSGEVVYANLAGQIISTTRGILATGYGPTISPTTGEIAFTDGVKFYTTAQGTIAAPDPSFYYPMGVGDVNDNGEVVYELRNKTDGFERIYSTLRGYISPAEFNAIQPAINNLGEVVYCGFDAGGHQEIYSSTRGQLTFFGGAFSFDIADLPDINNRGDIVFRGFPATGGHGLYLISTVPEPASWIMFAIGFAALCMRRSGVYHWFLADTGARSDGLSRSKPDPIHA
jgi:PEP-CTERM motif